MKTTILFRSELDIDDEDYLLEDLLSDIEAIFEPCFMIGTVGRWNGSTDGYKYIHTMNDFRNTIAAYDIIEISQTGTRIGINLYHHDGTHYMELRKLTGYGYDNCYKYDFSYYNQSAKSFIDKYTKNFGKVS